MTLLTLLMPALLAACDDDRPGFVDGDMGGDDTGGDDTGSTGGDDTGSTGGDDTSGGGSSDRQANCGGMDPADPAPLGGWVALTFDDGPRDATTRELLDILRAYDVPAAFMMVGVMVEDPDVEDLVLEIQDDPLFTIGNHSWAHDDYTSLSLDAAAADIGDTTALLQGFGADPTYFRFPYGNATCDLMDVVREQGLIPIGWHIDTGDWCYATGDVGACSPDSYWRIPLEYETDMATWTLEQVEHFDGGVMLYHDIHQYTVDQIEDLIITLQAAGYTFTSIDDAEAFPRLTADEPYDFPWVGERCSVSDDTCWEIEYHSWCEPTGAPGVDPDIGVCVLPCDPGYCIDRDGVARIDCVDVDGDGFCLAYGDALNDECAAMPGTVQIGGACWPYAWQ